MKVWPRPSLPHWHTYLLLPNPPTRGKYSKDRGMINKSVTNFRFLDTPGEMFSIPIFHSFSTKFPHSASLRVEKHVEKEWKISMENVSPSLSRKLQWLLNFWDFGPPPPPLSVPNSRNLASFGQKLADPLPPSQSIRHLCIAPNTIEGI